MKEAIASEPVQLETPFIPSWTPPLIAALQADWKHSLNTILYLNGRKLFFYKIKNDFLIKLMETVHFDLSCFKEDFQKFILKKLNCENYFDFLDKYKNEFLLIISKHSINSKDNKNSLNYQLNEEDSTTCEFKNCDLKGMEESIISDPLNLDEETLNIENINTSLNIDAENPSRNSDQDDYSKELDELTKESDEIPLNDDIIFSHYIEDDQIIVNANKKIISKRFSKRFKKNGGEWNKSKNIWIFPLSSMNFVEKHLASLNSESYIKTINHEKNKALIIPKLDHPSYGVPIIYDKIGNIGIWDANNKGWIFQKK